MSRLNARRKTIKRSALSKLVMASGIEKRVSAVILDGCVHRWVGIGWVDEGKATASQQRRLPIVVDG